MAIRNLLFLTVKQVVLLALLLYVPGAQRVHRSAPAAE